MPQRWREAADNYKLLHSLGIVDTVNRTVLDDSLFDTVVAASLRVDFEVNRLRPMFSGRRRWQMLESRLSPSVYRYVQAGSSRRDWFGQPIVDVPHAVAASITLTTALVVAHELGVSPITDQPSHDELLRQRLRRAALETPALPGVLRDDRPYTRRRVEMRLLGMMVPASTLRRVSMQDIVDYRDTHRDTRRQLGDLIDRLADQARHRPWDVALDDDLEAIAEQIQQMAASLPGTVSARKTLTAELTKPSVKLKLGASAGLTAYIAPNLPLAAGLIAGATTLGAAAKDALLKAYDQLRRDRTPEENALAYLVRACSHSRR